MQVAVAAMSLKQIESTHPAATSFPALTHCDQLLQLPPALLWLTTLYQTMSRQVAS